MDGDSPELQEPPKTSFDSPRTKISAFLVRKWQSSKPYRAFQHRDFTLLWFGAFISFIGSWVQNVAQGYLVYELTGSKALLAWISFASMIPVTIFGLFAGSYVDKLDRKKLLLYSQIGFACISLFLAVANFTGFIKIWMLFVTATIGGTISAFEMPARQAVISGVVPKEDLPAAIPMQALTFNLARIIGPAIGGRLVDLAGVGMCYALNTVSFSGLILGITLIRSSLSNSKRLENGILDLVIEGAKFTLKEVRLKQLFILEVLVSIFAMFYLAQIPAVAKDILRVDSRGLGDIYTAIGMGAVVALALNSATADIPIKGLLVKLAMTLLGASLLTLSFVRDYRIALPLFFLMGMGAVIQFNTTNLLFQLIAPETLRGRVVSMHIWAISGIGPFGTLAFGALCQHRGIPLAMQIGGGLTLISIFLFGWLSRVSLEALPKERISS